MGRPSMRSSPVTNSAFASGLPMPSALRTAAKAASSQGSGARRLAKSPTRKYRDMSYISGCGGETLEEQALPVIGRVGLASRSALCERSAEDTLQSSDEVGVAKRSARSLAGPQSVKTSVARLSQKSREIGNARQHRRDAHKSVVFALQIRPHARPRPVFRACRKPRTDGIEADVAYGRHEMAFVQRYPPGDGRLA